jgi:CHASE3 domain sensor protein
MEKGTTKEVTSTQGWSVDGKNYAETDNSVIPALRVLQGHLKQLKAAGAAINAANAALEAILELLPDMNVDQLITERDFLLAEAKDYRQRYTELVETLGVAVKNTADLYNEVDQQGYFEKHGYKPTKR